VSGLRDIYTDLSRAPEEGVDYELVELSPAVEDQLSAARHELASHIERVHQGRRRRVRAQRRRALSLVGATLLALAIAVGGASAVGLDVPIFSDAFRSLSANRDPKVDSSVVTTPSNVVLRVPDAKPGSGSIGEPVEAVSGSGVAVGVAYVDRNDAICFVVRPSMVTDDGEYARGCRTSEDLDRLIGAAPGVLRRSIVGEQIVLAGFARPDVVAITGRGPDGPLVVKLSSTWTPDVSSATPLRLWLGVTPLDTTANERGQIPGADLGRGLDLRNYDIVALMSDGSRRQVKVLP
jgi:hypothetical protein